MNTEEIEIALRAKYAPPEYAIFFEVRNGTGFARKTERYADAIAMNLYPSRGLEIIGFELKASRQDWLRELKNPDKAEEIGKFCDRWYVVVGDKDIVKPGELPAGWGLIVPRGNSLIVSTEAPAKHAKAVDKLLVAALLRAAVNQSPSEKAIKTRVENEIKDALNRQENNFKLHIARYRKDADDLRKAITEFESASGVQISIWDGKRIGEAVRFVLNGGLKTMISDLGRISKTAREIHEQAQQAMELSKDKEPDRETGT